MNDPARTQRSLPAQQRFQGAVRTILITYGIAAYTYLLPRSDLSDAPGVSGMAASAHNVVLVGLGLQLLLMAARMLIKRYVPDRDGALQAFGVLAIVGDGATVLLFALGTLGTIMPAVDSV